MGSQFKTVTPSQEADLLNRFHYHKPDEVTVKLHEDARRAFFHASKEVFRLTEVSREQALALTHLEEAMFWTNAAIARIDSNGLRRHA